MSHKRPSRRRFLTLATTSAAFGLAGCQVEEDGATPTGRGQNSDVADSVEEFLALQADLGDALDELDEASQGLLDVRLEVRSLVYGAVATGGVERYAEAKLPEGMDRKSIFGASREQADGLAEAGYREHAPESVQALSEATERHARARADATRRLAAVAETARELPDYWNDNPDLFAPDGGGATTVEPHPQFADESTYMLDLIWSMTQRFSVFRGTYPDLYADIANQADQVLEECDRECVKATVNLATGEGQGFNPDDHAWIRLIDRYERTCEGFEPSPTVFVQAKGLYLNEIKSDYGRPIKCTTDSWTGTCDDPDFRHCEQTIYDQMSDPPMWSLGYNCADWAIDQLRAVDENMADDLYEQAHSWGITWPSDLC